MSAPTTLDPAVGLAIRLGLALLWGVAAAHKLRAPRVFAAALGAYRLLPRSLTPVAAAALVAAELVLAAALLATATAPSALVASSALLLLYAGAVGVNLARGRRDLDCGCSGPARHQPLHEALVLRNLALAALAGVGLLPAAARPLAALDAPTVIGAVAAAAILYAAADRLIALAPHTRALRSS